MAIEVLVRPRARLIEVEAGEMEMRPGGRRIVGSARIEELVPGSLEEIALLFRFHR
jgi:hypothetical protein